MEEAKKKIKIIRVQNMKRKSNLISNWKTKSNIGYLLNCFFYIFVCFVLLLFAVAAAADELELEGNHGETFWMNRRMTL